MDQVVQKPCDFKRYNPLEVSHDCHRHCGSGDIMIVVCNVISHDLVIKRSRDFVISRPLKNRHIVDLEI